VLAALVDKRHEVAQLEKRVEDRKEALKAAKDELDTANVQLGRMIDQFEQDEIDRRQAAARQEADSARGEAAPRLVRCAWEQAHPDEDCPMCADEKLRPLAPDAALHVEQVDRYRYLQESDVIRELVQCRRHSSPAGYRQRLERRGSGGGEGCGPRSRTASDDTPEATSGRPSSARRTSPPTSRRRKRCQAILPESCRECGARLLTVKTGGDPEDAIEKFEPYPAGTLVGTDCPGAGPARYPKRGRGKKASARE
jgi:hypothetical protein